MFIRLFIYRLRVLLRNRSLLFWTFAFPVVLGLLFNLAFGNLDEMMSLETSKVGIVSTDETKAEQFKTVLKEIKDDDDEVVFKSKELSKKKHRHNCRMMRLPAILKLMQRLSSYLLVKAARSKPF